MMSGQENVSPPSKPFCLQFKTETAVFAYNLFCLTTKWPCFCKTHGFGLQNAAYWPAKPMALGRKMHAFRL